MKSIFKKIGYFFFLAVLVLGSLELFFRFQIVDFYRSELVFLNPQLADSSNPNVLVFGDSFSAHPDSYVKYLREEFAEYNFINSAIPGTGIKQLKLIIEDRIKVFKPKHIIYQFYVGNDFTDIKHPINFKDLSIQRNLYWVLSDKLLVLSYINRKLGFLTTPNKPTDIHIHAFSKENYNKRVATYFMGDPKHLSNTIELKGEQIEIYEQWKNSFSDIENLITDSIPITLILIPHCAQVSTIYKQRMQQIGAVLSENSLSANYPLYIKMKEDFPTVTILNPLKEFQNLEGKGIQLYHTNDPHLNLEGQKYLGDYLIKNLKI